MVRMGEEAEEEQEGSGERSGEDEGSSCVLAALRLIRYMLVWFIKMQSKLIPI